MAYLDVITLSDAKEYLRVEGTDSDTEITRMIKSALALIEKQTNILVFNRDVTYNYLNGCVRVYDYPINSTVSTTHEVDSLSLYSIYTESNAETKTIDINVGHDNAANISTELIDAALEMIDYWYYKNDGKANITLIPPSVQAVIDLNKRFIL